MKNRAKNTSCASLIAIAAVAGFSVHASAADIIDTVPEASSPVINASNYGLYVKGFGGITFNGGADTDGIIGGTSRTVSTDQEVGYTLGGAIGYEFDYARFGQFTPRAELELSYSRSKVDEIFFSGNGPATELNVSGDISTVTGFANVYLDYDTDTFFTPYAGVGLGAGRVNFDFAYGPNVRVNESDTGVAAQAILGGSFAITDGIALDVDARYQRIFDVSSQRINGAGAVTGIINGDVDTFALTTGLRLSF